MIRNVFLATTLASIAAVTRERYVKSSDRTLKSLIGYTYPELIPGGYGYMSLAIIIDGSSNIAEISPQIIIDNSADAILQSIMSSASNDPGRQYYQVNMDDIKKYIVFHYNEMTKSKDISILDNYTATRLVAQMLTEDLTATMNYIEGVRGDRNTIMFKNEYTTLPDIGRVMKNMNAFVFEDGINIVVTGVYMNPDKSYGMNYDIMLSDNINRAVKYDNMFSKLTQKSNYQQRSWQ